MASQLPAPSVCCVRVQSALEDAPQAKDTTDGKQRAVENNCSASGYTPYSFPEKTGKRYCKACESVLDVSQFPSWAKLYTCKECYRKRHRRHKVLPLQEREHKNLLKRSRTDCQKYFHARHCLSSAEIIALLRCTASAHEYPNNRKRAVLVDPLVPVMDRANTAVVGTRAAHTLIMALKKGDFDKYSTVLADELC